MGGGGYRTGCHCEAALPAWPLDLAGCDDRLLAKQGVLGDEFLPGARDTVRNPRDHRQRASESPPCSVRPCHDPGDEGAKPRADRGNHGGNLPEPAKRTRLVLGRSLVDAGADAMRSQNRLATEAARRCEGRSWRSGLLVGVLPPRWRTSSALARPARSGFASRCRATSLMSPLAVAFPLVRRLAGAHPARSTYGAEDRRASDASWLMGSSWNPHEEPDSTRVRHRGWQRGMVLPPCAHAPGRSPACTSALGRSVCSPPESEP